MKLSKALIGAILIGITIQTTGCDKDESTKPDTETAPESKKKNIPDNCPACGMG